MNKRFLSFTVALLSLFMFSGCGKGDTTSQFEAVIEAVTPMQTQSGQASQEDPSMGSIFVTIPEERATELSFDKASVGIRASTKIILADGSEGSMDDLKTGMNILVSFDGLVMESYPVQLTASKINIQS